MSTKPRIESAIEGERASFAGALMHTPEILARFGDLYAAFWQRGVVSQEIKEMTRIRNARVTDCGYWRNVRFTAAREAGLNEERVAEVEDGYAARVSSREAAALQLTDDLIGLPGRLTKEQILHLKQHFSEAEVVELVLGVGLFLGMSKVLITLGLEPEEMETTLLPTPGSWCPGR